MRDTGVLRRVPEGHRGAAKEREHDLSVSNCRISRTRLAPTDKRTAISRLRVVVRASCRLATFTQAISNRIRRPAIASANWNSFRRLRP